MRIEFRKSEFKLPENKSENVIMIGAGTGVAPFVSFLQEREVKNDFTG